MIKKVKSKKEAAKEPANAKEVVQTLKAWVDESEEFADKYSTILIDKYAPELDSALKKLFYHRVHNRIAEFERWHRLLSVYPDPNRSSAFDALLCENRSFDIGKAVCKNEYAFFKKDLEYYRENHREEIIETIDKAKKGHRRSIYKLVKWDKSCLSFDFIEKAIAHYQHKNNKEFFENLSDSIRKKSETRKAAKEEDFLIMARFYYPIIEKRAGGNKSLAIKKLHEYFRQAGATEEAEGWSKLDTLDYFRKYLKRHKVF